MLRQCSVLVPIVLLADPTKKNDKIKREMKKNPLMKQCKKKIHFTIYYHYYYYCDISAMNLMGIGTVFFFLAGNSIPKHTHTHTDKFDQNILLYRFCNNDNNNQKKIDQFRFNRLIHHHIIIIINP